MVHLLLKPQVRVGFDTKEFRAVLLAAYNWRSAQKKLAAELAEQPKKRADIKPGKLRAVVKTRDGSSRAAKRKGVRPSSGKTTTLPRQDLGLQPSKQYSAIAEQDLANVRELTQSIFAFLDRSFRIIGDAGIPLKKQYLDEAGDFYRAGHRLPGSYGSNQ